VVLGGQFWLRMLQLVCSMPLHDACPAALCCKFTLLPFREYLLCIQCDLELLAPHVDAAAVANLNAATQKLGICVGRDMHGLGAPSADRTAQAPAVKWTCKHVDSQGLYVLHRRCTANSQ
jgi:hypothetical protein